MKKLSRQFYFELAVFCMDYHSGQWSRGYRIYCRLKVERLTDSCISECRESEAYQWLVANYAKTV